MPIAISTRLGKRSVRTRILAVALIPSLSLMLVGLGSAVYTGYRGYRATSASGEYAALGAPDQRTAGKGLLQALRDERRVTAEFLADAAVPVTALQAQWATTDAAAAAQSRSSAPAVVSPAELSALSALRPSVMSRSASLVDTVSRYSAVVVAATGRASTQLSQAVADPRVVREDEIDKQLGSLTEALEESDALSFSAFTAAGMSADAFRAFVHDTGDFQTLLTQLQPSLPADEAAQLNLLTTGPDGEVVAVVQRSVLHGSTLRGTGSGTGSGTDAGMGTGTGAGTDTLVTGTGTGAVQAPDFGAEQLRVSADLPVPRQEWRSATSRLADGLVALRRSHLTYAAGIARDVGQQQITTALIGSVLLLVFALAVLGVTLAVSRGLIGRLLRLRRETIDLSRDRLPTLVRRLRDGEQVDLAAEMPPVDHGSDEIGQVADAFDEAQRTAVAAAAREAETRAGLRAVFLDIAHRSQSIVYRQLKVLDQAERTQEDPAQLELLFQLDHLATRARRNAENLIIMGGGQVGRQWRTAVPLRQLIRGAVSETEDYARVSVTRIPRATVPGSAVADVIHLIAELVDNATRFSPPHSRVEVRGNLVGRGLVIEIEDQGLGIEPEVMERFNQMLHEPPDFQVMALAEEPRLGLFVVARLAARHGIRTTLTHSSAYGGTKVVVLLPATLLIDQDDGPAPPALPAPDAAALVVQQHARGTGEVHQLAPPGGPRAPEPPQPAPGYAVDPQVRTRMSTLQRGIARGRAGQPEDPR